MFIDKTSQECIKLYKQFYSKSNSNKNVFIQMCNESDDIRLSDDQLILTIIFNLINELEGK